MSSSLATKVLSAEIAVTNFIAQHNLPFLAADHLSDLLTKNFLNSKIAEMYSCKRTKTVAIITDVLEPHHLKPVLNIARNTSFNLLCDESNERGADEKLLTVLVPLYDPDQCIVVAGHLETVGVTDFMANGMFTALVKPSAGMDCHLTALSASLLTHAT